MAIGAGADRPAGAIVAEGLTKTFRVRGGIPQESSLGAGHWIAHLIVRYRLRPAVLTALGGIDLSISKGEFFGILGPNGAGKTTLLKCLSTMLVPDAGTAKVNGYDVLREARFVRDSIVMVGSGQWVAFDWGLTVFQNLSFFAHLYGLPKSLRNQRIGESLEAVGLTSKINRTPTELSAGERQRLSLARALLVQRPIVFLDEPTANLDPVGTVQVMDYIREHLVSGQGSTCIYTTHRTEEAEEFCTRVAIMSQGRIIALGTVKELSKLVSGSEYLEIQFTGVPTGLGIDLERIEGVRGHRLSFLDAERLTGLVRLECVDAECVSRRVLSLLDAHGLDVQSVRVSAPRLSDVFLSMVRSPRAAEGCAPSG